jgi:enoyl-CoA hydratase
VATLTLNRPNALNALSMQLGWALNAAISDFEADDSLRVAILTGAGDRAFCAGVDLKSTIPGITSGKASSGDPAVRPFSSITKPIIAAVNGLALAGGTELLLGTDIRVAAEHAVFGLPEPSLGLVPIGGSHVRLPQQIPWAVAMEIMLIGEPISAQRALEIGLINRIVPAADLMPEARAMADRILRNGPLAVRKIKEAVLATYNLRWDAAFTEESRICAEVLASDDAKEGPRAFAEKRPPVFRGA